MEVGVGQTWVMCGVLLAYGAPAAAQTPPTAQQRYVVEGPPATVAALRERFGPVQLEALEALNRADLEHLPRLDAIVVPEAWHADIRAYSPFPLDITIPGPAEPRLLLVHQPAQAFAAYEHGRLIRWGPVSTGRANRQTPRGLFHLNWRSPGRHSTVNPRWYMPWYYNFHNHEGLSFHEYALPGTAASHACVRLLERDARWLYDWGEGWTLDERGWEVLDYGTPVLIVGCYAFGEPPPWRSLAWLARGVELPASADLPQRPCP